MTKAAINTCLLSARDENSILQNEGPKTGHTTWLQTPAGRLGWMAGWMALIFRTRRQDSFLCYSLTTPSHASQAFGSGFISMSWQWQSVLRGF